MPKGIVGKLWLSMLILVVVVLGISAVIQAGFLKNTYYKQQADRLVEEGERLAQDLAGNDTSHFGAMLNGFAQLTGAGIVVINSHGAIEHWHGMGGRMGMGGHGHGMMARENTVLLTDELSGVFKGNNIVIIGHSSMYEVDTILAAIPVGINGQIDRALIISAPLAPLAGNLRALQVINLYALLAGVLAATLLSFFISSRLSRPLREMNELARAMARGDYKVRVPVRGQDEITLLAMSLNTLSSEIEQKVAALERIDTARREFVANVSHELRTPLTIVQGYIEAINDGLVRDEEKKEQYLENIHAELLRLRRLVDELLDMGRLESGRIELNKTEVDVAVLIKNVVERFALMAAEKEITLNSIPHAEPALINGDYHRLQMVLNNLIDNAIRHTPHGGSVTISAEGGHEYMKVSVKDTGPGIPQEEQELIWERFYKVDKARTRAGGSGLGLAIAKGIVEVHGGEIGLISRPGEGSTFYFTLPKI